MTSATLAGRVLVVDDSPLALELLQQALRSEHWEVATAPNTITAFPLIQNWLPEVIVSDLHMPGMDGVEFVQRIQTLDPTLPVVMTSTEDSLNVVLGAVHAGVYDYVPKSGDLRALFAAVGRAAQHTRTTRENLRLQRELQRANHELEGRVAERTAQLSDANHELQRLMSQLVSTERLAAIGQLAAGIAHEINNPLSYVLSNLAFVRSQLAQTEAKGNDVVELSVEELQQALREAEDGATRITEIVRDVRTMSRTDDRARGKYDVNTAIRSATRIAGEQIRRRARLELELAPGMEIIGSVGRMTQVLINLLVNAADAIEDAPGREHEIRVTTTRRGDNVVITVADTGSGIETEKMARIFEPFFTTKPEGRGTGLGLSICRDIVERHSGRIEVQSEMGVGTRFVIELPSAHLSAPKLTLAKEP